MKKSPAKETFNEPDYENRTDRSGNPPGRKDLYYKMISEIQDYAIILLDIKGIILNWNKGAQKIKLYTEEEAVGKSFKMFYLEEDRANGLPEKLLLEASTSGSAIHEGWRVRKDKTTFWGSITLTAIHDDSNNVIGFSKVTRDLTKLKKAQDQLKEQHEALQKSEQQYQRMVAEVQDYAIFSLDENGNINNWNAGAEKIKQYSRDEIIGRNFRLFYSESDQKSNLPEKLLLDARVHGRATHEGWRLRKDGSQFWAYVVITALHDSAGNLIGYSKVTRDLTDKKRAEDEMRQYMINLEKQNKELEQFAYITSHDLQEPLRKIRTFTSILQKQSQDDPKVERYLEKILTSSERMSALIQSLLNYSKVTGTTDESTEIDLNLVFTSVKEDLELIIQEKRAVINCSVLPVIHGNKMQVSQLFLNIISNALKFSSVNPLISIKSRIVSSTEIINQREKGKPGKYMEISFADNGLGFEQKYDTVIFSMFQRLYSKDEHSGTGIGLALCKKIMDLHNGYITVQSELGKGATFYVYFPVLV